MLCTKLANAGLSRVCKGLDVCSPERCAVLPKIWLLAMYYSSSIHAAARDMRPLDSVLTSLASFRVGRCTAVQLGRVWDTAA